MALFAPVALAAMLTISPTFTGLTPAQTLTDIHTVFAIGPSNSDIVEWTGSGQNWTVIGPKAFGLYDGSAGVFYTDAARNIFSWNGTPNSWSQIGGPGSDFADGGGVLVGVGPTGNYVAEWSGSGQTWTEIGGPASEVFAGWDGVFALSPDASTLYKYLGHPGQWQQEIGGLGNCQFAVGDTALYAICYADGWKPKVYNPSSQTWQIIATETADQIAAGGDGFFAGFATDGIKRYNGTPGSWTWVADDFGGLFEVGYNEFYVHDLYPNSIEAFPGVPGSQAIGGSATTLAAGD